MLAFLFATIAFVMASAYAAASNDVEIRKTHVTLPQCGNLTLSWSSGVAPYTAVITDVTTGASDTITSEENSLTWTIDMPIFTKVSFVVTDAKNTISGSGPYRIVWSGETSCLCGGNAKRELDEPRAMSENIVPPKRLDIDLPAVSEQQATSFVNHGSLWSKKHAVRAHRNSAYRFSAANCPE